MEGVVLFFVCLFVCLLVLDLTEFSADCNGVRLTLATLL